MNHGAPAATTTRSGKSGSKIRSAPRSSALRVTTVRSPSWSVSTWGTRWRHLANRSDGVPARRAARSGTGEGRGVVDHRHHLDAAGPAARGGHDHLHRHQVFGQPKVPAAVRPGSASAPLLEVKRTCTPRLVPRGDSRSAACCRPPPVRSRRRDHRPGPPSPRRGRRSPRRRSPRSGRPPARWRSCGW